MRICWFMALERAVQTLWVGALWAIGYLAVPILFSSLDDRQLAGELAGYMFTGVNLIGTVSGVMLLVIGFAVAGNRWLKMRRAWVLVGMWILVLISAFVLQPMMQELKSAGLMPGSDEAARFGMLHGISSVLYLITSLAGLYVVVTSSRGHPQVS